MSINIREGISGSLSAAVLSKGIDSSSKLIKFLAHLEYCRISDPQSLALVVTEMRGTCSTKHAFLKALAVEQQWQDVQLILCMYKMSEKNTPGIGDSLSSHDLEYMPEAHCYVRIQGEAIDVTRPGAQLEKIEQDILLEVSIEAEQVGEWKKNFHRSYLADWAKREGRKEGLEQLWAIRENCIQSLVDTKD